MIRIIDFCDNKNGKNHQIDSYNIEKFLAFPSGKDGKESDFAPWDKNLVKDVIMGKSPVSDYMDSYFFIAGDENTGKIYARCALFVYPGMKEAYFGFFQAVKDGRGVKEIITAVEKKAGILGIEKLAGPVQGSFFTGYRFKTGGFNKKTYFGEPQNPPWYPDFFKNSGYTVSDTYHSFSYRPLKNGEVPIKARKRYMEFLDRGYVFKTLAEQNTNGALEKIYRLISSLYSDFPVYSEIKKEDFLKIFSPMKYIADKDMIITAEKDGKPRGFLIAFPDYGDSLKGLNPVISVIKSYFLKMKAESYVFLYIGAEEPGLGQALTYLPSLKIAERKASSISALIHEGKITGNYMGKLKKEDSDQYEYVLLSKNLKNKAN